MHTVDPAMDPTTANDTTELDFERLPDDVRKLWMCVEHVPPLAPDTGVALRKVAACAVLTNPFVGRGYVADLSEAFEPSAQLASVLGRRCAEALDGRVDSYGKAGLVGTAGEQEHANAFLTSAFGDALRHAVGGGAAWITSTTKVAATGAVIDVPLAFKDEIWVRSHYDTITFTIPDAPRPDEIVVIAAAANRGRINARLGGLSRDAAQTAIHK